MGALASSDIERKDRIVSKNPATGEVLGDVPDLGAADVKAAVARAREAQRGWSTVPVKERAARVGRFRDQIVQRAAELCELIVRECGKTRSEALSMEVMLIADLATYFVKRAPKILAPEKIPLHLLKNRASYVHYVPRGVVGIIAPWNFPFGIPIGETVMALLAGDGVGVKARGGTTLVARKGKGVERPSGAARHLFQGLGRGG